MLPLLLHLKQSFDDQNLKELESCYGEDYVSVDDQHFIQNRLQQQECQQSYTEERNCDSGNVQVHLLRPLMALPSPLDPPPNGSTVTSPDEACRQE